MKKVQVLMSTYNGEKYLKEQIDSLLNQSEVEIELLVRDDGSSDSTTKILNTYKQKNKLDWYTGENLKSAKSFMDLINTSGDFEYYAFADQDDYWEKDKIITAIKKLEKLNNNEPNMYCSNKEIVDENLRHIVTPSENYKVDFESAMIRNIATGCTMVMNRKLIDKIKEYKPEYVVMHDCWAYRVCLALDGNVIYDNQPHIKYRQHNDNVIGAQEGIFNRIKRRINSLFYCDHSRKRTAVELLKGYKKEIAQDKIKTLEQLSNYDNNFKYKMQLLRNKNLKTESVENNIIFKMALLINKI